MSKHRCKDLNKIYPDEIEPNKYMARTDGKVYSIRSRRPLKPNLRNQYYAVGPGGKTKTLHKLLALAFIRNPDPKTHTYVDHIDNNKFNNDLNNLRWITPQDNTRKGFASAKKEKMEPLTDFQKKIILRALGHEKPDEYPPLVTLLNQ